MSFYINLPLTLINLIKSWELSPRLIREILEHLYEELAESPHEHLVRISPPEDILQYSFIVLGEGDPPRDYLFEFTVRYATDEETLVINDCRYLSV